MVTFQYGGKTGPVFRLTEKKAMITVRTENDVLPVNAILSPRARGLMSDLQSALDLPFAGVQVFRSGARRRSDLTRAGSALKREKNIRFIGAALAEPKSGA